MKTFASAGASVILSDAIAKNKRTPNADDE
jgi:hypothetical protein